MKKKLNDYEKDLIVIGLFCFIYLICFIIVLILLSEVLK